MVSPKTVAMLSRRAVVRAQPWGCAAGQAFLELRCSFRHQFHRTGELA